MSDHGVSGDGPAARSTDALGARSVQPPRSRARTLHASTGLGAAERALDAATHALVRAAAVIAAGDELAVRNALAHARDAAAPEAVEEVVLQSYLFAGFPRALNAMRTWRKLSGRAAPAADADAELASAPLWRTRGEATCAHVYGPFYERLRHNIAALHPALDSWMIVEGYGKVLGRPTLDLVSRELCIVAVCAVARQERQLHSHLHGALHVGAAPGDVRATLDAIADLLGADAHAAALHLWSHVAASRSARDSA